MSPRRPSPPRLARWLMARLFPGDFGGDAVRDLDEEFTHFVP